MNNNTWVIDVETLKSCFTYVAKNVDNEELVEFVIHKDRNDITAFVEHLKSCKGQIGFNNVNFDYPIIHNILCNYKNLSSAEEIIEKIYEKAQQLIQLQDNYDAFYSTVAIKRKDWIIPQLDLYKMWHYNNAARRTSLKALEISMNFPNVMESKVSHTKEDITLEEVEDILIYNRNDVLATFEFYKKSREKIDLRKSLTKKFNIPCINYPDTKIGEELILKLYTEKINQDNPEFYTSEWDIKKLRTHRSSIDLNECILPNIQFKSKQFSDLLNKLKSKVIKETKNAFAESVIYKGFKYDYGTGGIHGCIKPGIYESDRDYLILDADVTSLYPNLAISYNFYPQHLGEKFIEVYKQIVSMRAEAKKAGDTTLSDGFKLSANGAYGKSNDADSFLYDPKFTMQITLNGQLLLTLLAETLVDNIKDIQVIQINTDGITVKIPRDQMDNYYSICKQWESISKLSLEYAEYSRMIIADVNNYLAVTPKGKVKNKGRFEVDKVVGSEPAYHKDNSFRIVPLALQEYFVNGVTIEDTIYNHKNIYDFCGRQKFKSDSYGQIHYLVDDIYVSEPQQKNVRYYISNKGSKFIKYYNKGTTECINKGYVVNIFNEYYESDNYDINYNFYIQECKKELHLIENKQLELF